MDVDLSQFVPDAFKGEDGEYDTASFRGAYDDLLSFKEADDARKAEIPESADAYEFVVPEGHQFPEGFDAEAFKTKNDKGEDVAFDPNAYFAKDDPDIALVRETMHLLDKGELKPAEATKKLAGLMVNRQLREQMAMMKTAAEEKKALGPDAPKRIETIVRTLNGKLTEKYSQALADGLTSADAVRAMEELLRKGKITPPADPGGKPDMSSLNPMDRLVAGLQQRKSA